MSIKEKVKKKSTKEFMLYLMILGARRSFFSVNFLVGAPNFLVADPDRNFFIEYRCMCMMRVHFTCQLS